VEALLAELLAALGAEEVLGVPGFLQGGHTFLKEKISSHLRTNFATEEIYGKSPNKEWINVFI